MRLILLLMSVGLVGCELQTTDPMAESDGGEADASMPSEDAATVMDGSTDAAEQSDAGPIVDPVAYFTLPRDADDPFWELPWPSDIRRSGDTIDVMDFPNPRNAAMLNTYKVATSERVGGYSLQAPIYFTFEASVDEDTLPSSPSQSLEPDASIFLVDVDTDSPTLGERRPLVVRYVDQATVYWPGRTIAARPIHGLPLRGDNTYALVVTRNVKSESGADFVRSDDLDQVLSEASTNDEAVLNAREVFAEALVSLDDAGVQRDDILNLTVLTTQDATGELMAMRDWADAQPAPEAVDERWMYLRGNSRYDLIEGAFVSPQLQSGVAPFETEGGDIVFDDEGAPILQGTFDARFALAIPRTPMPAEGFPIVLYSHGTGGDYMSFLGTPTDLLTAAGYAVMGIDQIHHGDRNPTPTLPEILTFNFLNPHAFRDNARQSAIDIVAQARFARDVVIPASVLDSSPEVRFDASHMLFFGHSQGGITGSLFMAIDDSVSGGVLSGAGGHLPIALVEKTEPLSIPDLVRIYLKLPGANWETAIETEQLVHEHPALALLQTFTAVVDPVNYGHLIFHEPREGFDAKSLLQTEGTSDPFTPPLSIESLALSFRVPLIGPELREISGYDLSGLPAASPGPVQGNVAGGEATAGLVQYVGGHFVVFEAGNLGTAIDFLTGFESGLPSIN